MRFTSVILAAVFCLSAGAETNDKVQDTDDAIVAAAEKLISEGKEEAAKPADPAKATEATATAQTAAATTAPAPAAAAAKKESEIPVFTKSEKTAKDESSLIWRLVSSLVIVAAVGGGMIIAARRWGWQRNKGGEKARIEVLHQYHMGPRKSLALIRVAGEAMLIGCTDHSINMIKPVTLIDDELEGAIKAGFDEFIDEEFSIEDMKTAITSRPRA